jgi:hypothetical protein
VCLGHETKALIEKGYLCIHTEVEGGHGKDDRAMLQQLVHHDIVRCGRACDEAQEVASSTLWNRTGGRWGIRSSGSGQRRDSGGSNHWEAVEGSVVIGDK